VFDGKKFLTENYHTPQHVQTVLGQYGLTVTLAAAEKWWQRASVPGNWLAVLIAIKEIETGAPISIARYLRTGE
jgi:hypothetical protein